MVADVFVHPVRDANLSGRRERHDSRGDVHAVAQHRVFGEQHVADVNADMQRHQAVASGRTLERAGATDRLDRALEARQRAVAQVADQAAVEARQDGAQEIPMTVAGVQTGRLVAPHRRGVARDIAEHYRSELAGRIIGGRFGQSRQRASVSLSLVEIQLLQQRNEARVFSKGIEDSVHFHEAQQLGMGCVGLLEAGHRALAIAQT